MAENTTPNNNPSPNSRNNGRVKKIETLQLRRLMKQEKENRELRKQMTTLLNYQRELEKRLKDSVDMDEEIRKNNASIDRILKQNQKYERALQSAQEKLDEEQSDFYRMALQDNATELNRLKELNAELRKGNKNTEEQLEDMQDTMEDMNENFSDNLQSLIDSFNIMAIKDSMDEGIAEISKSMIDITNALHLDAEEADAFKKTLSNNLKDFNKLNNNMLNSADMQEAVAKLIEAGITDTNTLLQFWESIAVADKLGYDIGSQQGIMQYVDSEADIENILGSLVKTKGLDGVNQDGIIDAVNSFMPSISHLSDEQQARILNEAISTMAIMQSQGIKGFEDLYADMIADAYSYDASKSDTYFDKYGANASVIGQQNIGAITQALLSQVDMAGFNNTALESFGWTEEMIDSANKTNANSEALLSKTEQLVKEDSMKALDTALEDFHTSVIDNLKNKISPYLMTISNEVSSWGLDWSDISGMFLTGKGIWDLVKGIAKFFGIGSLGAGASATATAAGATGVGGAVATGIGGKIASMGGALWGGIKGIGATVGGAIGGTAGAVALAVPAVLGYLGFKDAKALQKAWEEKSPKEQEDELKKKVIQYMKEEQVIQDQSKSRSQFDAYGTHRNGLDKVPFDGYKAILHSGEAVLTRDEAQKYRANPDILKHSEKDLEVFSKNTEAMNRNEAFAQRTLSLLDKIKSKEVLGKAKETAQGVYDRLKTMNTYSTTSGSDTPGSGTPGNTNLGSLSGNTQASAFKNMTNTQFIDWLGGVAVEDYAQHKILPSLTIAQGIIESGWGKSGLTQKANALFGIKAGSKWSGRTYSAKTAEYGGQGKYYIKDAFRAYENCEQSVADHGALLNGSRYSAVRAATNYKDATRAVKQAGYATDPNYTGTLNSMIQKRNLDKWDAKVLNKYEQGTPYVPTDQIALLHKGEMVVPKDQNPMNSGKVISSSDDEMLAKIDKFMQLVQWGFEFIGKKQGEEKIVQQSTGARKLDTLNDRYQNRKLGR